MTSSTRRIHQRIHHILAGGIVSALLVLVTAPVAADPASSEPAPVPAAAPATPHESVTEELIRLLQKHNALSKDDAESLIRRLQAEQAQQTPAVPPAAPTAPATAGPATGEPAPKKGDVRVIYIPESEKQKIREQVKEEVLATAKAENWAQPNALPNWLNRISFSGDFRFRQEFDLYDRMNSQDFLNFNALNSGAPFDFNGNSDGSPVAFPILNTTQNRELPRFRARLGVDGKVSDDLTASFRFASGNTSNPVSTNQTLSGDFNKYSFVIDRAYLDWHPLPDFTGWLGRMPRPWTSTNLVWWEDLGFDGAAFQYHHRLGPFTPRLTLGAFSIENTALDFPSNTSDKVASRDKWLLAAQLGSALKVTNSLEATAAVAYYYYHHLQGELSSPCDDFVSSVTCSTDNTRPGFVGNGNTLFPIRVHNSSTVVNGSNFQYFGLATPFHDLDFLTSWDFQVSGPIHAVLTTDYVINLAYKKSKVLALVPSNNIGPDAKDANGNDIPGTGVYQGGNQGYQAQLLVGYPVIHERWQWNTLIGYKRVETDATVDAFNDPDFGAVNGVGGTNRKGFFLLGGLGLDHNTWAQLRYFSATEVTGQPLSVDTIQLDLNAGF